MRTAALTIMRRAGGWFVGWSVCARPKRATTHSRSEAVFAGLGAVDLVLQRASGTVVTVRLVADQGAGEVVPGRGVERLEQSAKERWFSSALLRPALGGQGVGSRKEPL
jgi:hypothetical protein